MRRRIIRVLIGFGITIHECLLFAALFRLYTIEQLSPEQQKEVLVKAIPFVAIFVAVLLTYICLIVILAIVLHARVPHRTYYPAEWLIISGIAFGVVGLFQPWWLGAFEYGFGLLLVSLLAFIAWSHISPRSAGDTAVSLSRRAHGVGAVIGVLVAIIFAATVSRTIIQKTKPQPPYGVPVRMWEMESMYPPEEKDAIADEAKGQWNGMKPFYLLVSLLPGGFVYLIAREVAAHWWEPKDGVVSLPPVDNDPLRGMAGDPAHG